MVLLVLPPHARLRRSGDQVKVAQRGGRVCIPGGLKARLVQGSGPEIVMSFYDTCWTYTINHHLPIGLLGKRRLNPEVLQVIVSGLPKQEIWSVHIPSY